MPAHAAPQVRWSPTQQPGYAVPQQMPQHGFGQQGRSMAAHDRIPAQPELMQRPAATVPARSPRSRGSAQENPVARQAAIPAVKPVSGWQPIRIPTPDQLGIATAALDQAAPLPR